VNVRDIVLEEGFGVDDFGLRAEAIHRVPRGAGRQSLPPRWRHELELAFRDGHQLALPPCEACAFGHTIDDTRQLVAWASVHRERNRLELRITILRGGSGASGAAAGRSTCLPGSTWGFGLRHTPLLAAVPYLGP
jgi:hypothetical protein